MFQLRIARSIQDNYLYVALRDFPSVGTYRQVLT